MHYVIEDERLLDPRYKIMKPSSIYANSVDIRACTDRPITIYSQDQAMISAGIKIQLPWSTTGMLIPRSGLGCKGVVLGNTVGNIDPDYRGIVHVCVWNRNTEGGIIINPMERIAQLIVMPVLDPNTWLEVDELNETERGEGGFGSTGIH